MAIQVRVGISFQPPDKNGRRKRHTYTHVQFDDEGWADATLFLPFPFDLLHLKTSKGPKRGWWTGGNWEGLNFNKGIQIYSWKRGHEAVESN